MFQKNNWGGLTNILWLAEKKWGGLKAQLLLIAQGNALGGRIPRLIHSAFLRTQKCHAPRARNSRRQCHGALPLIMKAALFIMSAALGNPSKLDCPRLHDISERDTLINAFTIPRALPGAVCNNWAYSPPQSKAKYKSYLLVELCAKCLEGTTERKRW